MCNGKNNKLGCVKTEKKNEIDLIIKCLQNAQIQQWMIDSDNKICNTERISPYSLAG